MNEAALEQKRKIVEIPLPSFPWKLFFSFKSFFAFSILAIIAFATYWVLAVRPYLWIHSGKIDAVSLSIRANEAGTMSQIAVQEGDRVQKGQILFSLENEQFFQRQKKIQSSLMNLREQQIVYKRQSEKAMQDYLSDLGVLPQEEIEPHLQVLQESQAKIGAIQLETDELEQQAELLKSQLERYIVTAPFEGVVLKQNKSIGDPAQIGEPVLSLFDLKRSWIEVRVPEKSLHLIEVGQLAKIRLPSYPGREWQGSVQWIGPATLSKIEGISSVQEEIPIKISLPKDAFPLKPGLSAEVGIKVR